MEKSKPSKEFMAEEYGRLAQKERTDKAIAYGAAIGGAISLVAGLSFDEVLFTVLGIALLVLGVILGILIEYIGYQSRRLQHELKQKTTSLDEKEEGV